VKKGVLFYFERKGGRRRVRCRILKEVEGTERATEREASVY
jgi:hypothetical protein